MASHYTPAPTLELLFCLRGTSYIIIYQGSGQDQKSGEIIDLPDQLEIYSHGIHFANIYKHQERLWYLTEQDTTNEMNLLGLIPGSSKHCWFLQDTENPNE